MTGQNQDKQWKENQIPLKDVVLSNSWALQAILMYLDEENPGARDRIWQLYLAMKEEAEKQFLKAQDETESSKPESDPAKGCGKGKL